MPGAAPTDPIALTVIGGYLGAGKTTLLNHVLRHTTERVAVLVNDFGALNIDQDLIEASDDDMITLANGCICCSLVDGFASALSAILALDDPPPRLVVETSGVAQPATVAAFGWTPGFRLDGVVVLADAETIQTQSRDRYVGDTVLGQLAGADLLVLTKIDLVDSDRVAELHGWFAEVAPGVPVLDSIDGAVPFTALFGNFGNSDEDHLPLPRTDALEAEALFETQSWSAAEPIDDDRLAALLDSRSDNVIRIKGVVRLASSPEIRRVVQVVGARQSMVADGPWAEGPCRLVAIARQGTLAADWLSAGLA